MTHLAMTRLKKECVELLQGNHQMTRHYTTVMRYRMKHYVGTADGATEWQNNDESWTVFPFECTGAKHLLLTREDDRERSLLRCFCIAFFSTCRSLRASAAASAAAASSAAATAAASSFSLFSSSAFLLRAAALSDFLFSL